MLQFLVSEERCTRCGQCIMDCPSSIIEAIDGGLPFITPEKEALCIQCQHCLAGCPTGAISILGKNPDDSIPLLAENLPSLEQMLVFVRARRSIRHYKDENVVPELLQRLLAAVANAPTGVNKRELTFNLIDDREVMQRFRLKVRDAILSALDSGRSPASLGNLARFARNFSPRGSDGLFRGAPHALIVSAPANAPCPEQDVPLALAYFELLAQSAGLGTVWWGMLKHTLETLPGLKPLLGINPNDVYYGMLFGMPAIQFARTVQRDDAAQVRRIMIG